ncbi:hypothetical protein OK074_5582 [Actinobacteria bacterium OK074]|nr:hypothetical protein OK074_5582 [Actinobacteria bacterium OK074]
MASLVHFKKVSEDSMSIRYAFGEDPDAMTRHLTMNAATRTSRPDDGGSTDYLFLKASRKINALRDERGHWPERGMSAS